VATIFNNFPQNEVTKFSAVFHATGFLRYILGCRGNKKMPVGLPEWENGVIFLARDRFVFSQK